MKPVIQVSNLRYRYPSDDAEQEALQGINFSLEKGASLALVGPTGSGKSTLLQHLNGLLRGESGQVTVLGRSIEAWPALRELRAAVGYLFQRPEDQLFEHYLSDDIGFAPLQYGCGREETARRVRQAMQAAGLDFSIYRDRLTAELSGGERRKAAIAGVLALEPEIILLDEPTIGLDPVSRREIISLFSKLKERGTSLVVASHDLEEVARLCDHALVLHRGQQLWNGPVPRLFSYLAREAPFRFPLPPAIHVAQQLREQGFAVGEQQLTTRQVATALKELLSGGTRHA